MWRRYLLSLLATIALTSAAAAHSLEEIQAELFKREQFIEIVDRPALEFTLQDAAGKPVRLADFRGKVVVLYFIYAGCPDVCPLQSRLIADIQKSINSTPMRDLVQFVAITTDPERDTPDVMAAYPSPHGLDPANWIFLTSGVNRPEATRELAEQYGLKFTLTKDGAQMHGIVTHVIDREGRLRARFHGLDFDPTNFIVQVNALTNDHPHPQRGAADAALGLAGWRRIGLWLSVAGLSVAAITIAVLTLRAQRRGTGT